jgi:hypothetical protein
MKENHQDVRGAESPIVQGHWDAREPPVCTLWSVVRGL